MKREPADNQTEKGRQNMTPMLAKATDSDLLTLSELADRLKMHPDTVRGLWRRRAFPGLRIGHRTLRFEYKAVLDALRQTGDQAAQ